MSVVLLAVLQGIAEFLPISSSGHLLIAGRLLDFNPPGVRVETMLHFGTLLAICLYYQRRLRRLLTGLFQWDPAARRQCGFLLLSSLPIVGVYLVFHEPLEAVYENSRLAAAMLLATGGALLSLRLRRPAEGAAAPSTPTRADAPLCVWRAVTIGLAQALAILPGISRSGATIVAARHLGLAPAHAAEFSFLMSIPPLLGGTLLSLFDQAGNLASGLTWSVLALGALVAAVVGYGAITVLLRVLNSGHFWMFGVYCLAAGGILLISGI
jgi:undecaprenyl-diphosphatase